MTKTALILAGLLLATIPGIGQAGHYGHGYYGGHHGYGGHFRRGGFYRGHRFRRGRGSRVGYLVGGLALGALAHSAFSRPRAREVVYVERAAPPVSITREPSGTYVDKSNLQSWYYRDRNGNCSFVERDTAGGEIATPVPPEECNF